MQQADQSALAPRSEAWGGGGERTLGRVPFPLLQLVAALLATMGVIGWLLWSAAVDSRASLAFLDQAIHITELRSSINHLNEVLRMSARAAVESGDVRWRDRYRASVPVLDARLTEAMELSPPEAKAAIDGWMRAANEALMALELQAFDAARSGGSGVDVLDGGEYAAQ